MKRRNPILTVTSVVLVFFLFAPIVVKSLDSQINRHSYVMAFTKSSNTPTKADSQMPFEEKEMEEKGDDHFVNQLPLIYIITEIISYSNEANFTYPEIQRYSFYGSIPLYLAKRSILI